MTSVRSAVAVGARRYFVTGGSGYLGRCIVKALLDRGADLIVVFDKRVSPLMAELLRPNVRLVPGDVLNYEEVREAIRGLRGGTVFHLASYGMSGLEMMQTELTRAVNVTGTENVIRAALMEGMHGLVYTSTLNVVFADKPISGGDETLPYAPLDRHAAAGFGSGSGQLMAALGSHPDMYSRSKCLAEQIVLRVSGTRLDGEPEGGRCLSTCALRATAIYGDGEERHLPRIVGLMRRGLFRFTFGSRQAKIDWVYGENLAHAHLLAAEAMARGDPGVAGEAFFITDENPMNNFEFLRPLCEGLGYRFPTWRVPLPLMLAGARLAEMLHRLLRPIVHVAPPLSRAEVYQVAVEHYFSTRKARERLGYRPIVPPDEAMRRVIAYHVAKGDRRPPGDGSVRWRWGWLLVAALVLVLAVWLWRARSG